MRINVHVPDHLSEQVREQLPNLNVSAIVQEALGALLDCAHERMRCTVCGTEIGRDELAAGPLDSFYRDLLAGIDALARDGGTVTGSAAIARDVARRHGVASAEIIPLPRPTRAEREEGVRVR